MSSDDTRPAYNLHWLPPPVSGESAWRYLHERALTHQPDAHERAIVKLLQGWIGYAKAHMDRYEGRVGDDGVLGPEWEAIGRAVLGLLNGQTGRLDCGTLDAIVRATLAAEGLEEE